MEILYSLTPEMGSVLGSTTLVGATTSAVGIVDLDEKNAKGGGLALGSLAATALYGGLCLINYAYYYSMNDSIQYIQSLSNEELAELADELALISDNQKTNELVQQMDLIEQTELAGGVDGDSLSSKRQEIISNYLESLTIGEINEIYSELDNVTNLLPPEEKLEKQLSLIKK